MKSLKVLRFFIQIAAVCGIDLLFFTTVEPWQGLAFIAQLCLLLFLNVGIAYGIYLLMDDPKPTE